MRHTHITSGIGGGWTHTQVMCEVLVGGSVFGVALLAVVVTVLVALAGRDGGHSQRLQFDDIFNPAFKPELVCHNSLPSPSHCECVICMSLSV